VRIERGANASAAVRRIDRSRLQFSANDADNQAA
jgi:hypothetical protein